MKIRKAHLVRVIGCFLTGLCFIGAPQIASGSIVNGGFETGNLFIAGDINGWNATGNVFIFDSTYSCCIPSEGQNFANFSGFNKPADGELSQSFATVSGVEYLLTFDFGKGGNGAGTASLKIDISGNGSLLSTTVSDTIGGLPGAYDSYAFNFVANSLNTTLLFKDISIGTISSFDALLDNVSVSAVPIPAGIWLFGTALIGLIGFNKRRKSA